MVSLQTPICDFGWNAPEFSLLGVDGKVWTLDQARGPKGTLVMFICNHCPYVKSIRERLVADLLELKALGVHAIAISSNDTVNYPEDSYENMQAMAREFNFSFPYVWDETQSVAKAYGAICTPDFFGFDANLTLQYRGRFDDQRRESVPNPNPTRDLFRAMQLVSETGHGPAEQIPSIGCSIKWLEDAA